MGWSVGFDPTWKRDIGYGVPAYCDHPGCGEEIDRGLSFVCGGEPYGGTKGCGLFFCGRHLNFFQFCDRCTGKRPKPPFEPTADHPDWLRHKLTDESWAPWREQNPAAVQAITAKLVAHETERKEASPCA